VRTELKEIVKWDVNKFVCDWFESNEGRFQFQEQYFKHEQTKLQNTCM